MPSGEEGQPITMGWLGVGWGVDIVTYLLKAIVTHMTMLSELIEY